LAQVSKGQDLPEGHQFILKPVTGEGRVRILAILQDSPAHALLSQVTLNHKLNKTTPKINVDLIFSEIGFILDDHQYRDAISLVDMYHFATRQAQYRKFRPPEEEITKIGKPKAMLKFAADAIMYEVHERKRKWSWDYFRERRDDRNAYVRLFKKQDAGPALVGDVMPFSLFFLVTFTYTHLRFKGCGET
jgi:vacuolar protein sorting-associated protein 13A/C